MKLSITIEEDYVLEALKRAALARGLSLPEIAAEIIQDWYDDLFREEDIQAMREAQAEPEEGIPWEVVRDELSQAKPEAST